MSARDVIARCVPYSYHAGRQQCADAILSAITAAGYRIVPPGGLDAASVERCASELNTAALTRRKASELADNDRDHTVALRMAHELEFIAAALRSLIEEPTNDAR